MTVQGEKYEYAIDFDKVAAIDIHTHVEVDAHGHKAYDDELVDAVGRYFKRGPGALSSVDALARRVAGVTLRGVAALVLRGVGTAGVLPLVLGPAVSVVVVLIGWPTLGLAAVLCRVVAHRYS